MEVGRGEREIAEWSEEVSSQVLGSILVSMLVGGSGGLAAKSCLTDSCNPMDCSPPGIFQARILEWVAIFFSRDLPDPGIEPASLASPALVGTFLTTSTTWGAPNHWTPGNSCY